MHEDDHVAGRGSAGEPGRHARAPAPASGDVGVSPDGPSGDQAVDAALSRLVDLDRVPVREHVAVFDAVHAALQGRLADVEE